MNTYRYPFVVECPNDRTPILYHLTIKTDATILAEDIIAATKGLRAVLHEQIADALAKKFGGDQTITAVHQGVTVETLR
jgi:hypothetical protein